MSQALSNVFKLRDVVSIKDPFFAGGAKGDGTDATAATLAWLAEIQGNARGYVPAGVYPIDPILLTTLVGDIEIECHRNAVFKYRTAVAQPLFEIKHSVRDVYSLIWKGGIIDNSDGLFSAAEGTNTCLALTRMYMFSLENVFFRGELTKAAAVAVNTGTDSGVSTVDCYRGDISACWFRGQGDQAIYLSGNNSEASAADDGGHISIQANSFWECQGAVSLKRQIPFVNVNGNSIFRCRVGVSTLEASSVSPGRAVNVIGNTFKFLETRAFECKQHEGSNFSHNIVEDFGRELSDGTTLSSTPHAVRLLGCTDAIVADNRIYNKEWANNAGIRGVTIEQATINTVLYTPSRNQVHDNYFEKVGVGVLEGASVGRNFIKNNQYGPNVTTKVTLTNADTLHGRLTAGQTWTQGNNIGSVSTSETDLHSITLPANTLDENFRSLRIIMYGSTPSNANAKTLKLYFGGTVILTVSLTINQLNRWRIEAFVMRTASNSQKVSAVLWQTSNTGAGTVQTEVEGETITETDTAAIVVKATGQGTANNDVLQAVTAIKLEN